MPLGPLDLHPKVTAATLGGAALLMLLYGLTLVGVSPPAEVDGALLVWTTFLCGYLAPSSAPKQPQPPNSTP